MKYYHWTQDGIKFRAFVSELYGNVVSIERYHERIESWVFWSSVNLLVLKAIVGLAAIDPDIERIVARSV